MPSTPYDLSIGAAQADALSASPLQRSDEPTVRQVQRAIATAISVHGVRGCAARVAQAYGEHPETALTRMRWATLMAAAGVSFVQRLRRPLPDRLESLTGGGGGLRMPLRHTLGR